MAQKNFWAWLNMGKDGQPIEGESGSGQQYFASEAPITRPATAESIVDDRPSKLWNLAYWAFYLTISVVFFFPMIFALIVIEIGEWIHSVLDWLDEQRG
jgi:hypothetical protein